MSRERELLKKCLSYFDGAWEVSVESELYKEIEAELDKPEPEPVDESIEHADWWNEEI